MVRSGGGRVIQPRAEPALGLGEGQAFALRVVGDLILAEFADGKVARLRVRKIEAAHTAAGPHRVALGELDAGLRFRVEQLPERALFRVVRARRVAGCGADAAVLFVDEIVGGEVLSFAVAPFVADALVQALGERLGEPVGDGFGHDGVVVVEIGFEILHEFIEPDAGRDGECCDVIRSRRRKEAGTFARWMIGLGKVAGGKISPLPSVSGYGGYEVG